MQQFIWHLLGSVVVPGKFMKIRKFTIRWWNVAEQRRKPERVKPLVRLCRTNVDDGELFTEVPTDGDEARETQKTTCLPCIYNENNLQKLSIQTVSLLCSTKPSGLAVPYIYVLPSDSWLIYKSFFKLFTR